MLRTREGEGHAEEEEEEEETIYFVPAQVTFRDTSSTRERCLTRKLLLRVSDDARPEARRVRVLGPLVHPQVFQLQGIDQGCITVEAGTTIALTVVLTPPESCEPVNFQDWIHALDELSRRVYSVALRSIHVGDDCSPHEFSPPRPPPLILDDFFPRNESASCSQGPQDPPSAMDSELDPEEILNAADALLQECGIPAQSVYQDMEQDDMLQKAMPHASQQWSDSELAFYQSIVVDKRDAVKHDEGLKEHFEELNFYRSIIAKEEELKQQEGQLTEESGPSPIKKKPDGFFIEQEIDSKGRIRVKQDSVLMPSIDSQHDLFMVDGVLVNALGEEVQPVKGSQDHSQVVAPQTMSATRISREEDGSNSDDDLSLPWQVPAEVAEKILRKEKLSSTSSNLQSKSRSGARRSQVKDKSRTDVMEEYNKRLQMQATQKVAGERKDESRLSKQGSSLVRQRLAGMEHGSKPSPTSVERRREIQSTSPPHPASFTDDRRFKDNWDALG